MVIYMIIRWVNIGGILWGRIDSSLPAFRAAQVHLNNRSRSVPSPSLSLTVNHLVPNSLSIRRYAALSIYPSYHRFSITGRQTDYLSIAHAYKPSHPSPSPSLFHGKPLLPLQTGTSTRKWRVIVYCKPPLSARTKCSVAPPSRLYSEAVLSSAL